MNWLVPLPVVLPLLGAGLKLAIGYRLWVQATISLVVQVLVLVSSCALLVVTDVVGTQVVQVGDWAAPLGITLVADRLAALLLTISAAVTTCVLVFSISQGIADRDANAPIAVFYPSYLIMVAGISNAFLTGDLFNLYVSFEILLVASYVLLTLGGTEARIQAGSSYVIVNVLASMIFLVGIGLAYAATGTLNLADLSQRLAELPPGVNLVIHLTLLMAFAIKAALFPLSAWLPDSYPTAPTLVTAVFAGLLTKVGVYAIIRTEMLLFPGPDTGTTILLLASVATLLIPIFGAIAQTDMKRLLSFTLISHIGYLTFGIALGTKLGVTAAIFYTVHHIVVQTALFLCTGLVERRKGTTAFHQLRGVASVTPIVGVLFFIPAMNLSGIPPLSGFIGKLGLLQAGVADGDVLSYVVVVAAVLTSLLTLYAIAKLWNQVFWGKPPPALLTAQQGEAEVEEDSDTEEASRTIATSTRLPAGAVGATIALVALSTSLTVFAGPLLDFAERAAGDLIDGAGYVTAVDGGDQP